MAFHLFDNVKVIVSVKPQVATTDTTGVIVDTLGYHDGMLIVSSGAITGTGTDIYTVTLWENDSNTTSGATTTSVVLTFTGSQTTLTQVARIADLNVTRKRYVYAKLTCSATTISFAGAANIALTNKDSNPVN